MRSRAVAPAAAAQAGSAAGKPPAAESRSGTTSSSKPRASAPAASAGSSASRAAASSAPGVIRMPTLMSLRRSLDILAEMRAPRRILAVLERALAVRDAERCGVALAYRASVRREPALPIVDYLDLRPGGEIGAALGLAKLLRLLREARLSSAGVGLGEPEVAAARLARALGREFQLEVAPRSRVHFEALTEDGTLEVADVSEVAADDDAFVVRRVGVQAPVRV